MKRATRSFYELAVQKAVAHVIASLDGALDFQALARFAALSPFHFHRIFRGMVGETPLELHRRLRMERAAWTLFHEARPVTEVAFAAGYETHESFTRAFRIHYDCSPSEFRKHARGRAFPIEIAARCGIHYGAVGDAVSSIDLVHGEHSMQVALVDRAELRIVTISHVGPYNRISQAFARLGEIVNGTELVGPETALLGVYHDDPETTSAAELRSDAAIVISAGASVPDGVVEQRVPAGRYACTKFVGPYEQLGDAWARFMGVWLPLSGCRIREAVTYEHYRNTPLTVVKERLETDLYLPIA